MSECTSLSMALHHNAAPAGSSRDPISAFYSGRDVFVTGGSGLMGKALLEKLLRSCEYLNNIFVLLRDRKSKSCCERLEDLKKSKIFDRIRQENVSALDKLVPISGDISVLGLGISEESIQIMANVSIVFHVAATVRFDEPLKSAIFLNVRGTREALNFAAKLKQLTMFVHVSTAYSNPYLTDIEEKVYPAMADWKTVIKMGEKFDRSTLDALSQKVLGVFPNTYTFTKHLAEHVVNDYNDTIPVCIIRPAIVTCSGTEPYPGWFDRIIAIMGVITGVFTGIVRTLYCYPDTVLDLIPLDESTKIFILVPWWAVNYNKNTKVIVMNLTASTIRSYSIRTMAKMSTEVIASIAFNKTVWVPHFELTDNIYYFYYRLYLFHLLPAMILDGMIMLSGRQPVMMRIQRTQLSSQRALKFFVFTNYNFKITLLNVILDTVKDSPEFRFDTLLYKSGQEIVKDAVLGCRRYILHESDNSLPAAVKRFKILKIADLIICKGFQLWLLFYVLDRMLA